MIVLDTSVLIEIEHGNEKVRGQVAELAQQFQSVPTIAFPTFAEFLFGFLKKFPKRKELVMRELDQYELLNTSKASARLFAELRLWLEKKGVQMTPLDLLIAAITIDNERVLVTCDKRFQFVPGLRAIVLQAGI